MTKDQIKNLSLSLDLIHQILEVEQQKDILHKKQMIAAHKGSQATGENWTIFHLKTLRELLLEVQKEG